MLNTKIQLSKFIIVGFLSTFYNYTIYIILYNLFKEIVFASIIGYSVGLLNSYIFGKIWVFKAKSTKRKRLIFSFLLIYGIGGLTSSATIYITNNIFGNYSFAWLMGTLFSTANNFLGSKYIVFKPSEVMNK